MKPLTKRLIDEAIHDLRNQGVLFRSERQLAGAIAELSHVGRSTIADFLRQGREAQNFGDLIDSRQDINAPARAVPRRESKEDIPDGVVDGSRDLAESSGIQDLGVQSWPNSDRHYPKLDTPLRGRANVFPSSCVECDEWVEAGDGMLRIPYKRPAPVYCESCWTTLLLVEQIEEVFADAQFR